MAAPVPVSAPEFSLAAIEQLDRALQLYASSWDEVRHETLHLALERMGEEAHAATLGPERMLVAVKAAWGRVTGIERVDVERSRVALEHVVGQCIDAYYSETS